MTSPFPAAPSSPAPPQRLGRTSNEVVRHWKNELTNLVERVERQSARLRALQKKSETLVSQEFVEGILQDCPKQEDANAIVRSLRLKLLASAMVLCTPGQLKSELKHLANRNLLVKAKKLLSEAVLMAEMSGLMQDEEFTAMLNRHRQLLRGLTRSGEDELDDELDDDEERERRRREEEDDDPDALDLLRRARLEERAQFFRRTKPSLAQQLKGDMGLHDLQAMRMALDALERAAEQFPSMKKALNFVRDQAREMRAHMNSMASDATQVMTHGMERIRQQVAMQERVLAERAEMQDDATRQTERMKGLYDDAFADSSVYDARIATAINDLRDAKERAMKLNDEFWTREASIQHMCASWGKEGPARRSLEHTALDLSLSMARLKTRFSTLGAFTDECRAGNQHLKASLDALVTQLRPALEQVFAHVQANQQAMELSAAQRHAQARMCARAHAALVDDIQQHQARLREMIAAFHQFSSSSAEGDQQ